MAVIIPDDNFKTGWIKLFRSVTKHWLWSKNKPLTQLEAWLLILIEVNHADEKVKIGNDLLTCQRGEKLYSLDTWGKMFLWDKSKVRRFFDLLQRDSMVVLKSERKTTRLIVCNYETYQSDQNANETQMKRKRNANETQMTPIKELKNEKNEKEEELNTFCLNFFEEKYINEKSLKMFTVLLKNYSLDQIKKSIENGKNDEFWKSQFLSPMKLNTKDRTDVLYIDKFLNLIPRSNGKDQHNNSADRLIEQFAGRIAKTMGS